MAVWLDSDGIQKTKDLLGQVLLAASAGNRVQFLVDAGQGGVVAQRLRVALSRSRLRNKQAGRKISEFTLHHSVYPYTMDGKRHDCLVMWVEKSFVHRKRELLDDLVERIEP